MNGQFILLFAGLALALSALFGAFIGFILRKHHRQRLLVTLGAAIFMLVMYSAVIFPAMMTTASGDSLNVFAMLPGMSVVFLLIFTKALYRLPIIGGPLLAWALATARLQAERSIRDIEKLEALEDARLSNKQA